MTAQPTGVKPRKTQRPRRERRDPARESSGVSRSEFDAHRWLELYRASHGRPDPSDPLAGVPFN